METMTRKIIVCNWKEIINCARKNYGKEWMKAQSHLCNHKLTLAFLNNFQECITCHILITVMKYLEIKIRQNKHQQLCKWSRNCSSSTKKGRNQKKWLPELLDVFHAWTQTIYWQLFSETSNEPGEILDTGPQHTWTISRNYNEKKCGNTQFITWETLTWYY